MLLEKVAVILKTDFLGALAVESVPGRFFPFSPLLEDFLEDSDLPLL
jgi:hypothetical protein